VGPQGVVCYSYPKLGLLCHSDGGRWVFDLSDFTRLEVDRPLEGASRTELQSVNPVLSAGAGINLISDKDKFDSSLRDLRVARTNLLKSLESGVSTLRDSEEMRIIPIALVGQDNDHFCAVASAKMILAFHGIDRTQEQIAAAMGTISEGPEPGTPSAGQAPAYKILSNNVLEAVLESRFDSSDSDDFFLKMKGNIMSGLPFKMGIFGHAYAIGGYKIAQNSSGSVTRFLYVYDPEPPKKGQIRWEEWGFIWKRFRDFIAPRKATIV
jgi:hypothetical protein